VSPVFVFIYLTAFQLALTIVAAGLGALLCTPPPLRVYRGRLTLSAIGVAAGGLVGAVVGYLVVILAGLAWLGMRFAHLVAPAAEISEHVIWAFPAGYVLGSLGGACIGWRRSFKFTGATRSI